MKRDISKNDEGYTRYFFFTLSSCKCNSMDSNAGSKKSINAGKKNRSDNYKL